MIRVLALCALSLTLLAGCVNAENSSAQHGSGNSANFGLNNDVTADASGAQTVNGSIRVPAGQKSGNVGTVNGSIHIDDNAGVADAQTVNGSIGVGAHATAQALKTVNGEITLEDSARIEHGIISVNGSLMLHHGSDVAGKLQNVNGHIELDEAHVGGGIDTVDGDIDVGANSRVEGGILVRKRATGWFSWSGAQKPPRIVIGPGAVVKGDLRFEQPVHLYVSDTASIGPVSGATPVKFSGATPPS